MTIPPLSSARMQPLESSAQYSVAFQNQGPNHGDLVLRIAFSTSEALASMANICGEEFLQIGQTLENEQWNASATLSKVGENRYVAKLNCALSIKICLEGRRAASVDFGIYNSPQAPDSAVDLSDLVDLEPIFFPESER